MEPFGEIEENGEQGCGGEVEGVGGGGGTVR